MGTRRPLHRRNSTPAILARRTPCGRPVDHTRPDCQTCRILRLALLDFGEVIVAQKPSPDPYSRQALPSLPSPGGRRSRLCRRLLKLPRFPSRLRRFSTQVSTRYSVLGVAISIVDDLDPMVPPRPAANSVPAPKAHASYTHKEHNPLSKQLAPASSAPTLGHVGNSETKVILDSR